MSKITPEQTEEILQLLSGLSTYKQIADQFGLSRERVRQIAKSQGLHGLAMKKRRNLRNHNLTTRLKEIYGQFYENGIVDKGDFLDICKHKFTNKKSVAKNRDAQSWTIQFCDVKWNTHCPILGMELNYYAESRQENSPSFDRIDNTKGYVPGNVQIISWRANRIKNNGTSDEHFQIAKYLKSIGH